MCYSDEQRTVSCTQDTQYMAGVICEWIITEYTHDEHCNIISSIVKHATICG